MTTTPNKRQFTRLTIPEHAIAFDSQGRELGRVSQAGGGGFLIFPISAQASEQLTVGRRMRITIIEPGSKASNTVDVEVRYHQGNAVGVQFVNK